MDTIHTAAGPVTGIVALGTLRRNGRTLRLWYDADTLHGDRFPIATVDGINLGEVTIPPSGRPVRDWNARARAIGISEGRLVESGLIKCLRALVAAIGEGETLSAVHGFVKDRACPFAFEIEELEPYEA